MLPLCILGSSAGDPSASCVTSIQIKPTNQGKSGKPYRRVAHQPFFFLPFIDRMQSLCLNTDELPHLFSMLPLGPAFFSSERDPCAHAPLSPTRRSVPTLDKLFFYITLPCILHKAASRFLLCLLLSMWVQVYHNPILTRAVPLLQVYTDFVGQVTSPVPKRRATEQPAHGKSLLPPHEAHLFSRSNAFACSACRVAMAILESESGTALAAVQAAIIELEVSAFCYRDPYTILTKM